MVYFEMLRQRAVYLGTRLLSYPFHKELCGLNVVSREAGLQDNQILELVHNNLKTKIFLFRINNIN